MARALQPAMLVVEDVDLIAEDRGMHPGQHPLLFQLLNEMDGLAEDADVVFVLTTNRADLLEPALAARPGRVDQAVALELPDAEARRALFELYRGDADGGHVAASTTSSPAPTGSRRRSSRSCCAGRRCSRDPAPPDGAALAVSAADLTAPSTSCSTPATP